MPFTQSHARLTWGGSSCNGTEQWSSGLRFGNPVAGGTTDLADVYDLIYAWLTDSPVGMSQLFRLGWVKLAVIDVDGRYPPDTEALLYERAPEQAGSTALNHPPQVSLAVTLETGVTRGRAARGRMYLPTTGQSVAADGRISSANAESLAVRTATFLDDLTDLMAAPVWVMSEVGAGTSRPVDAVSVGRVFDTQRRRRRQLDEDRVSALINP